MYSQFTMEVCPTILSNKFRSVEPHSKQGNLDKHQQEPRNLAEKVGFSPIRFTYMYILYTYNEGKAKRHFVVYLISKMESEGKSKNKIQQMKWKPVL